MKKNITISISKPHSERLETSSATASGGFCSTILKASFLGLLLLMTGKPILAQNSNEKTKVEQKKSPTSDATTQTIKGVVLSGDDSTALEGANIVLQGTGVGTIAGKEGRFVFPQQLKEGDVLLFSFVGQQTQEYKVPAHAEDSIVIRMKIGYDLTGEIAVNEIYTQPSGSRKWWAKVKRMF